MPFFRRLRQKLINQNRFTRYLLYAVGEIVLVIIGILIAINLNALNSERKDLRQEGEYYCRLKQDLDLNKLLITDELKKADERISLANKTIWNLMNQSVSHHTLMNDFLYSQRMGSLFARRVTFDFLIASGDISLLADEQITSSLTMFFGAVEDIEDQIHLNKEELARKTFNYESYTQLGYQEFEYVQEALGKELADALPSSDWYLHPQHPYYQQFLDNLVFVVTMNDRLKQHLRNILLLMEKPYQLLENKCAENTHSGNK